MPVAQTMYCSRFQFPDAELEHVVASILNAARKTNPEMGLTGCLAYGRGWFVQILEGDPAAVAEIMAHITSDARHTDVRILLEREAKGRSFPDWSMACVDLLQDMPGYLARGMADSELSPQTAAPLSLLMTLMNLADRNRMAS
jgi:hypothetical protein